MLLLSSAVFKIIFEKFFQEYHQSVNQFGSRPGQTKYFLGPDQFGSRSGPTKRLSVLTSLDPNCLQRLQSLQLAGKEQDNAEGVNGVSEL